MNNLIKHTIVKLILASTIFTISIINNQVRTNAQIAVTCGQELTVMPIGDSHTEGSANMWNNGYFLKGYRPHLWTKLNNMNFKRVDFVGTRTGFYNSPNIVPYFDDDHESWGGNRSDLIRDKIRLSQSVKQLKPTVVTLISGSNDIAQRVSTAQSLTNFKSLVEEILLQSPNTRIMVAAIPPMKNQQLDKNPAIIEYNNAITNYITSTFANNSVSIFDNSMIDLATDVYGWAGDGVHLVDSGDDKLTTRFAQQFNTPTFNSYKKCPNISAPAPLVYPNFSKVKKNDFNNDGKSDIIWRNKATGDNVVWYMNGKNYVSGEAMLKAPDLNWEISAIVDFNNDGKPDLLWRHKVSGNNVVWYMNGKDYLSGELLPIAPDLNWEIVGSGDFNNDGKSDIVWRNKSTGDNIIWYMNGKNFKSGTQTPIPSDSAFLPKAPDLNWSIVDINDYDYDGSSDLFFRNKVTGQNVVWYMNGKNFKSGTQNPISGDSDLSLTAPDLNWDIVGSGDFNYDNKPDLLWRHKVSGDNVVWYMNGKNYVSGELILKVPDLNWQIRNK